MVEHMGPLLIDGHVIKKKIRCTIWAGNKEIADFVKRHAFELLRRFESMDYRVVAELLAFVYHLNRKHQEERHRP